MWKRVKRLADLLLGDRLWALLGGLGLVFVVSLLSGVQHHSVSGIRLPEHGAPGYRALLRALAGTGFHLEAIQAAIVGVALLGSAILVFLTLWLSERRSYFSSLFPAIWLLCVPGTALYYVSAQPANACLLLLLALAWLSLSRGLDWVATLPLLLAFLVGTDPLLVLLAELMLVYPYLAASGDRLPLRLSLFGSAAVLGFLALFLSDPEAPLLGTSSLGAVFRANRTHAIRNVLLSFEALWWVYFAAIAVAWKRHQTRAWVFLLTAFFALLSSDSWACALLLVGFSHVLPACGELIDTESLLFRDRSGQAALFALYTLLLDWQLPLGTPGPEASYVRYATVLGLLFVFESGWVRRFKEMAN
jgi:hypothetical protein